MPVNSQHPTYQDWFDVATKVRAFAEGPDAVKAAGETFLPMNPGWTNAQYKNYVELASLYNAVDKTIEAFHGLATRRKWNITVPSEMEAYVNDATLSGVSLDEQIRDLLAEQLTVSNVGVLVEWDNIADRAKTVVYTGESIINWKQGSVNGKIGPTMVVLSENYEVTDPNDPFLMTVQTRYRVLILENGVYKQRVYTDPKDMSSFTELVPARRGQPLDFIPFVSINACSINLDKEKPVLRHLTEENISHFRLSADMKWALSFTGKPQPYISGWPAQKQTNGTNTPAAKPIVLGSSVVLTLPTGCDLKMMEYGAGGVSALRQEMQDTEIRMARLGARLLETPIRTETATAADIRHTGETALLANIINNLEIAIIRILEIVAQWSGLNQNDIAVKFNKDFASGKINAQEITALIGAWQTGAISSADLMHNLYQGEILDPENEDTTVYDSNVKRLDVIQETAKVEAANQVNVNTSVKNDTSQTANKQ